MRRTLRRLLPLFAIVLVFLGFEHKAHAAKGFMLITHGDEIQKVGELKAEFKQMADAELGPGIQIGYMYQHFGLFFLEVWTWEGKYVLFRDDEYWDPPEAEIAEMAGVASVDELGKPWQYKFPPGLGIVIVLIAGFVAYKLLTRSKGGEGEGESEQAEG